MASKGQIFNQYSSDFKKEVLYEYYQNHTPVVVLCKKYNIQKKTLEMWITKTNKGIDITIDKRSCAIKHKRASISLEEQITLLKKFLIFQKQQRDKNQTI